MHERSIEPLTNILSMDILLYNLFCIRLYIYTYICILFCGFSMPAFPMLARTSLPLNPKPYKTKCPCASVACADASLHVRGNTPVSVMDRHMLAAQIVINANASTLTHTHTHRVMHRHIPYLACRCWLSLLDSSTTLSWGTWAIWMRT